MKSDLKNYAFIDSQNLNLGVQKLGWKLSFRKFRVYLEEKYQIVKAYLFIGYIPNNRDLYKALQEVGYVLIFKPVLQNTVVKGNVDADLVLQAMMDLKEYDKAVIVSSDGDFYSLVRYLKEQDKLELVLSPNRDKCSSLLKISAGPKIEFMNNLRQKLEYK
ncbi:MAG: NYN domain-containing protein [Candidatus Komeilibacteria bacterium]|nr:NYN domain-containing protein [Candidatus Komeilibacteria bacterium]